MSSKPACSLKIHVICVANPLVASQFKVEVTDFIIHSFKYQRPMIGCKDEKKENTKYL